MRHVRDTKDTQRPKENHKHTLNPTKARKSGQGPREHTVSPDSRSRQGTRHRLTLSTPLLPLPALHPYFLTHCQPLQRTPRHLGLCLKHPSSTFLTWQIPICPSSPKFKDNHFYQASLSPSSALLHENQHTVI